MRRYFSTFLLVIFVFGTGVSVFSYFEKSVYCHISKDKILISLKSDGFLCSSYVRSLEIRMRNVFKDITVIQGYIDKGKDIGYWKPLKEDKVVLLNRYQRLRLDILSRVQDFESNLLITSKRYFLQSIAEYQKKLVRAKKDLLGLPSSSESQKRIAQIQGILDVIENISSAKDFTGLNTFIQRYVYLKQQLPGK